MRALLPCHRGRLGEAGLEGEESSPEGDWIEAFVHDGVADHEDEDGQASEAEDHGDTAGFNEVEGEPSECGRVGGEVRLRGIVGQAKTRELPTGGGGEEVAVGGTDVGGGGYAGTSAEDHL